MSSRTPQGCIFLVMASDARNRREPVPLRAFHDLTEAERWQGEVIDYHINPPDMPADDNSDSWKQYDAQLEAWRIAHPAGKAASQLERFGLYTVPLIPRA